MTVRKVWRMWSGGIGEAMSSTAGRVVQVLIVLLALAGLGVLALAALVVGAGRDGDAARRSSPRSAPPRWRPRGATRS